jgi:hypothetical protein
LEPRSANPDVKQKKSAGMKHPNVACIKNVMRVGDDVEMVGFYFLEQEPLLEPTFNANGVLQYKICK